MIRSLSGTPHAARARRFDPFLVAVVAGALSVSATLALAPAALASPLDEIPARKSDADRASKNGKLAAQFDGVNVVVSYGRPKVKKRTVWGDLVPAGQVWRAGADEATVIAFDKDVTIEGKKLAAGVYSLFTVPGGAKDDWTVIFNREPKQWGAYDYDEKKDALRVTVKPRAADHAEELTYEKSGPALLLRWEKVAVPVTIKRG